MRKLLEAREVVLILAILVLAAIIFLIIAAVVQGLWNGIAAPVFSAPVLTYWQTAGLLLLISLITGSLNARNK